MTVFLKDEKFIRDQQKRSLLIYAFPKTQDESRTWTLYGFHTLAKLSPWVSFREHSPLVTGSESNARPCAGLYRVSMQSCQGGDGSAVGYFLWRLENLAPVKGESCNKAGGQKHTSPGIQATLVLHKTVCEHNIERSG